MFKFLKTHIYKHTYLILYLVRRSKYKQNQQKGILIMNTHTLKSGDVVNNYKELCRLLCEEVKYGNSKKAQLKEFERYFQYEKHGHKFIILDIYDIPLPKDDKRQIGNRRIYVTYIESILLTYLFKLNNNMGYFTKRQLWRILGMINNSYKNVTIDKLREIDSRITCWELNKFYQICDRKLTSILFSALNSLQNRSLITYEEQYVIVLEKNNKTYIADDDEKKILLEAEKITLNDMGLYTKTHAASCFKLNEFYANANNFLYEKYEWNRVYKQYKIIFLDKKYLRQALNENEIILKKLLLNERVIEAINKHTEILNNSQNEKLETVYKKVTDKLREEDDIWGEPELPNKREIKKQHGIFTYPDYFVEIQKTLSQKLLKIGN